jgi:hypothetical protein
MNHRWTLWAARFFMLSALAAWGAASRAGDARLPAEDEELAESRAALVKLGEDMRDADKSIAFDPKSVDPEERTFWVTRKGRTFQVTRSADPAKPDDCLVTLDGYKIWVREGSIPWGKKDKLYMLGGKGPWIRTRPSLGLDLADEIATTLEVAGIPPDKYDAPWLAGQDLPAPGPAGLMLLPRPAGSARLRALLAFDKAVYQVTINDPNGIKDDIGKIQDAFKFAAAALVNDIEGDAQADPILRKALAAVIQAAAEFEDPTHQMSQPFMIDMLKDGYIEREAPDLAAKNKEKLDLLLTAADAFRMQHPLMTGKDSAGRTIEHRAALCVVHDPKAKRDRVDNLLGEETYTLYDPVEDRTTFAVRLLEDPERWPFQRRIFVHHVYDGKLAEMPADRPARFVRVVHALAGRIADYLPGPGKFRADKDRWSLAADTMNSADLLKYMPWAVSASWQFPPHAPVLDAQGRVLGLATPKGYLEMPDFRKIPAGAERVKAQEKYMDRVAEVLNTPGLLHLFFVHMTQYLFDSPLPDSHPQLIGTPKLHGDIHQTSIESLDRRMGGRFAMDCDDLAEFYQTVTRRQGKRSLVADLPEHAACAWVEEIKSPEPGADKEYRMFFLDTGPPRRFRAPTLNEVTEAGYTSYDRERRRPFNPEGIGFLLRFEGEQTRSEFSLASRMFVDPDYAETMIRVQGHWHLHLFRLGIEEMQRMVDSGDRCPGNCFELAGLYRELRDIETHTRWMEEGVKQSKDQIVLVEQMLSTAVMHLNMQDKEGARKVADRIAEALKAGEASTDELERLKEVARFTPHRFHVAQIYAQTERPYTGLRIAQPAVLLMDRKRDRMDPYNVSALVGLFVEMRTVEDEKKYAPTEEDRRDRDELKERLETYIRKDLFREDDSPGELMRNYGIIAAYYQGLYGRAKVEAELLKPEELTKLERTHAKRTGGPEEEAEDWQWIRRSPGSYDGFATYYLLNKETPFDDARKAKYLAFFAAAERALAAMKPEEAEQFDDMFVDDRLTAAALNKDWPAAQAVLDKARKHNWPRVNRSIAARVGGLSRFLTQEEFLKLAKMFDEERFGRQFYFMIAYYAFQEDQYDACLSAAEIAVKRFPENENFRKEKAFLEKLCGERKAKKKG